MSETTQPFFIVSSGRSGTAMLHKALSSAANIAMHHEYMVHIVQPLAVQRYLDLVNTDTARETLSVVYSSAVHYSTAAHWGDSSNKLSWLIPELAALLPHAKFVHQVRDGRKVASSYFHKLGAESYDDTSARVMQAHYDDPHSHRAPPPEKKYWWPVPRRDDPLAEAFRTFDQFERIAWHWAEINRVILDALSALPKERTLFTALEDLREQPSAAKALYDFLNLRYRPEDSAVFARPHNVNRPEDKLLDATQRAQFDRIAGAMMRMVGYDGREEYVVNY